MWITRAAPPRGQACSIVMDTDIQHLLDHQRHTLTTDQAEQAGLPRDRLCRAVTDGQLIRAARGAYVDGRVYKDAIPENKHLLRARAIQAMLPRPFALSHHSAACGWRLPIVGAIPRLIHVTRLDGGYPRANRSYVTHRPSGSVTVEEHDGLRLVAPALAWVGMRDLGLEALVAAGDTALRRSLMTRQEATEAVGRVLGRPDAGVAGTALYMLDQRSESAGESRCRVVLLRLGYDIDLQVEIRGSRAPHLARVDFCIREHHVVIEFDGLKKYGDAATNGAAALAKEKQREDFLRALGYEVVRLTWADLSEPERVRELVDAAIRRSQQRSSHTL